jgi:hypothetical protein
MEQLLCRVSAFQIFFIDWQELNELNSVNNIIALQLLLVNLMVVHLRCGHEVQKTVHTIMFELNNIIFIFRIRSD